MSKFHERGKAKAVARKQEREKPAGPKEPPAAIQLPGGITVRSRPFRITAVDSEGRPSAFELARGNEDSDCVMWAADVFLDQKLRADLDARFRKRIEDSIEGPFVTDKRDIDLVKGRYSASRDNGIGPHTGDE